jgi:hypothetical protein
MDAPKEHRWVSEIEQHPDGYEVVFCCECGIHRVEARAMGREHCPGDVVKREMLEALRPLAALASFYRDVDGEGPCFVQSNKGTVKLTGADAHRAARILAKAEGRNG